MVRMITMMMTMLRRMLTRSKDQSRYSRYRAVLTNDILKADDDDDDDVGGDDDDDDDDGDDDDGDGDGDDDDDDDGDDDDYDEPAMLAYQLAGKVGLVWQGSSFSLALTFTLLLR